MVETESLSAMAAGCRNPAGNNVFRRLSAETACNQSGVFRGWGAGGALKPAAVTLRVCRRKSRWPGALELYGGSLSLKLDLVVPGSDCSGDAPFA